MLSRDVPSTNPLIEEIKKYICQKTGLHTEQKEKSNEQQIDPESCFTIPDEERINIDDNITYDNLYKKIDNVFIYHGYKEYCGKYNSDHFPVVIDFKL